MELSLRVQVNNINLFKERLPSFLLESVSQILDRFTDINISPDEVVALMASHSIAAGHVVGGGMNSG